MGIESAFGDRIEFRRYAQWRKGLRQKVYDSYMMEYQSRGAP